MDKQHRHIGEFERQATEYARQWATTYSRRGLLKAFGAAGAVAAFAPSALAAAPSGGIIPRSRRFQDGGTLKIARGQLSDTLDPHKTTLLVAHEIMWQIYDSLIYLDEAGTVYPGAATEWTFSEDNLTVTFTLRAGRQLPRRNAVRRARSSRTPSPGMLDPATASPNVGMLGPTRLGRGRRSADRRLQVHATVRADLRRARLLLLRADQHPGGHTVRRPVRAQSGRHRPVQVRRVDAPTTRSCSRRMPSTTGRRRST